MIPNFRDENFFPFQRLSPFPGIKREQKNDIFPTLLYGTQALPSFFILFTKVLICFIQFFVFVALFCSSLWFVCFYLCNRAKVFQMNKSSAEISVGQPVTASPYIANFFIKTSQLSLLGGHEGGGAGGTGYLLKLV